MHSEIKSIIRANADPGDRWGSAMMAAGGMCDVLCHLGATVPAGLGYSPGMAGPNISDTPAWVFLELVESGEIDEADLYRAAEIMDHYLDRLVTAGEDY